jgi:hypothetical protein
VVANSTQAGAASSAGIAHPVGSRLPVRRLVDGTAFVEVRDVAPSGVLVAVNRP